MKDLVKIAAIIGLLAAGYFLGRDPGEGQVKPAPVQPAPVQPAPEPAPCPGPGPCPRPRPSPRAGDGKPWAGGPKHPDGTEIACDLPTDQHCRNVSSKRQGCCVQTSINHSARWQNVPALIDFQKWVQEKGLPGGAWPGAVDERIPACAKDRGYPVPDYMQYEGTDTHFLIEACKAGRMPGVTYNYSPTGRYGGERIAHMVTLVHADDNWFVILDNNYPGSYEWLPPGVFQAVWTGGRNGWAVFLLAPPPPPPPFHL